MEKKLIEIRWHGRGGQGAKTASLPERSRAAQYMVSVLGGSGFDVSLGHTVPAVGAEP